MIGACNEPHLFWQIINMVDTLKTKQAVLVVEKGRAIGIVTRHDVIEKS
jgi:predicted transcriptional regulator